MSKRKKAAARRARIVLYAVVAGLLVGMCALEYQVWHVSDTLARFIHAVAEAVNR